MEFTTRPAQVADIPHLARALLSASGGLTEAVYEGAIPGRRTELIVEHLFSRPNATTSFTNCLVAESEDTVLGSIHAFPMDAMAESPADPLVSEDRLYLYEPFEHMHADASFYIMAVAVYPEYRGAGIGRRLIAEAEAAARARGFGETSLNVFAENRGALKLYEALGYEERARQPVAAHDRLRYSGDCLLMTHALHDGAAAP